MKVDAPISLVSASYSSRDGAMDDFDSVWGARDDGDFHHTALAVLTRQRDGTLHVERKNNTARHLEWGGALLGAALFVLDAATGVEVLAAVGSSGAGAIVGHFRHHAPVEGIADIARLLEVGAAGLVAVVVNRGIGAVTPLLTHAATSASVEMPWGDLEEELSQDFARPVSDRVLVST